MNTIFQIFIVCHIFKSISYSKKSLVCCFWLLLTVNLYTSQWIGYDNCSWPMHTPDSYYLWSISHDILDLLVIYHSAQIEHDTFGDQLLAFLLRDIFAGLQYSYKYVSIVVLARSIWFPWLLYLLVVNRKYANSKCALDDQLLTPHDEYINGIYGMGLNILNAPV